MPETNFECVLCGEDKFEALPRWVGDSRVCDGCAEDYVAPRFHDALEHEHQYPPMWGNVEMDLWTFWDLFDDKFKDAWRKKVREYTTPVKSRLYCEHRSSINGGVCGAYLGTKGSGSVCCSLCHCYTCRRCEAGSSDISSAKAHCCHEVLKENPFEKLSKGRDYQQCPSCKKEIFQAAGCNHMVCIPPCETHFCFFCGEQVAARRSGHWQNGNCPRFGVTGKTMIWDNDGEHSVADSEELESEDEVPVRDFAELINVEHLIHVFDQAAEAEEFEDNRALRTRMPPSWVRRESRAEFFRYISLNLTIVLRVMNVAFDLDDADTILEEFSSRDRRIIRQLRLYQSQTEPVVGGPTELSDLTDELDGYIHYAMQTVQDLIHIVQQEAGRATI